jgi:hypothetical protein
MLRKVHGTNFFHIKFLDRTNTNIKCQNGPVLPPAHVFYINGQALTKKIYDMALNNFIILISITDYLK